MKMKKMLYSNGTRPHARPHDRTHAHLGLLGGVWVVGLVAGEAHALEALVRRHDGPERRTVRAEDQPTAWRSTHKSVCAVERVCGVCVRCVRCVSCLIEGVRYCGNGAVGARGRSWRYTRGRR